MTARLTTAFAPHHPALVTFVTAGDGPTPAILDALVVGGADVIELGMPFTDPMADGPAIQAANLRSLGAGTTTADIFKIASDFRARHPEVPLVLMGYANPMTTRGGNWFASECKAAGVDGVICVDLPPEEDEELGPALRAAGISPIRLATPTTDAARLPAVLDGASGFLYYVSVAGITGLQQAAQTSIETAVAALKAATILPVAVGFGVRTPEQAAAIAHVADGVVVGSAIVEIVGKYGEDAPAHVEAYIRTLAEAVHNPSPSASEVPLRAEREPPETDLANARPSPSLALGNTEISN
jgi:tryptophan synthase alpha chain